MFHNKYTIAIAKQGFQNRYFLLLIANGFPVESLLQERIGFGIFHAFALLSLFAIFSGMYPVLNRTKVKNWYEQHLEVMSWSVVGLYAALAAEITTRLFSSPYFFWIVGLASGLISVIGAIIIGRMKKGLK